MSGGFRFAITPFVQQSPALEQWLAIARRAHVNGNVFVATFGCTPPPSLTRSKLEAIEFLSTLFKHPAFRAAIPGVLPDTGLAIDDLPDLTPEFVFHLDGDLTGLIHYGGAYWKPERTAAESKRFAAAVVSEMFGDRWEDLEYASTGSAWTEWFHEVAWDATLLVIDRRRSTVTLVVATDTD